MLIRFEVENFRSIAEPVELSMVAVDKDRDAVVPVELLRESLLKVSAIYGPNASGKSNVVAALAWLRDAVLWSLQYWDETIPHDPFAFGNGPTEPSRFALELTVDGVRFEYQLEVADDAVLWEALYHYPMRVRRKVFERDGQNLSFQRGVEGFAGTKQLLTPKTLALVVARRFDDPLIAPFVEQVRDIGIFGTSPLLPRRGPDSRRGYYLQSASQTLSWFGDSRWGDFTTEIFAESRMKFAAKQVSEVDRGRALALLRLADLGIDDVQIEREQAQFPGRVTPPVARVRLLHKVGEILSPLDLDEESEGTKNWFALIGTTLDSLENGSLMVFDELDASLHPTLSAALIDLFKRSDTNPHGAQLIFTSHDTSLLNHLNRDEVWLTEKDENGATRLGSLAEFAGESVRTSVNLERAYLSGRFGALPDIDQAGFLRALGLIG